MLINEALPPPVVELWMTKITTWENDRSAENPYYTPVTSEWVYSLSYYILTVNYRGF